MTKPMVLWDLVRSGAQRVEVWCLACQHHGLLDTRRLIDRFGSSFPVSQVAQSCRCTCCGARQVQTRPDWRDEGPGVVTRHERSGADTAGQGADGSTP